MHTKLNELNKRIRIGAVSYLNTLPLIYGVKRSSLLMSNIELIEDYPSNIATQLLTNEIDIGLVPVAVIPHLKESHIITNFCIGSEAEVASVAIFSDMPIENVENVLLDYQSKTSVNLAKILLNNFWKKEVKFIDGGTDFIEHISGVTAGVVIGDRALLQRNVSKYTYDLALAWKQMTGLPFVFAAWVANKKLDPDFIDAFNRANAYGVNHIDEVLATVSFPWYDLKKYYTQNISYTLTDDKQKGLNLFLEYLSI